jgi:hypothetical protein
VAARDIPTERCGVSEAKQEPVAWAVKTASACLGIYETESEAITFADSLSYKDGADRVVRYAEVVPLYAGEKRFDAKSASVSDLLDRIKRFIDQTDPWASQVVDRDYKINTPESRNARKALTELRKRLAGLA